MKITSHTSIVGNRALVARFVVVVAVSAGSLFTALARGASNGRDDLADMIPAGAVAVIEFAR